MPRDRTLAGSVATGALALVVAVGYRLGTDLVRPPEGTGVPYADVLAVTTLVVVPFAIATGATILALRYRVVSPLALVGAFAALPGLLGWDTDQLVVGLLVVGPFVVFAGLVDIVTRARMGRLDDPPAEADFRALSLGAMAAVLYLGVFVVRVVLPVWYATGSAPAGVPASVDPALVLWYVLGASMILVGVPVALNRRFGLVTPLLGLVAYLLVDLAYLQPAMAGGAALAGVVLLIVWPLLAALLAGVGAVEWWVRDRRGEFDEADDGQGGQRGEGGLSVEEGLFGDRV